VNYLEVQVENVKAIKKKKKKPFQDQKLQKPEDLIPPLQQESCVNLRNTDRRAMAENPR